MPFSGVDIDGVPTSFLPRVAYGWRKRSKEKLDKVVELNAEPFSIPLVLSLSLSVCVCVTGYCHAEI
jgi:hypothetical protein